MEIIAVNLIINLSIIIIYLINFSYLFNKSLIQFGKVWEQTLYFALFNLFISIAYTLWLIRLILIPMGSSLSQWIWFWKLKIIFLILAITIIAFFGLSFFIRSNLKLGFILFLIPVFLFLIDIILFNEKNSVIISILSNITYKNINLLLILIFFIFLFYLALPIYQLLVYMRDSPNRNSASYKKSKYFMIALFTISISLLFNFASIVYVMSDLIIIFLDILLFFGGIIIYFAFKRFSIQINIEEDIY